MTRSTRARSAAVLAAVVLWPVAFERTSAQTPQGQRVTRPAAASSAAAWQPTKRKDGQPAVEGIYQAIGGEGGAGTNIEPMYGIMGSTNTSKGLITDPVDGLVPYLPWARVRRDEVQKSHLTPNQAQVDTRNRGWPDGVPRINYYTVNAFQVLQPEGAVLILYEAQHEFRYIPLDRRPQIDSGVKLWMGSSRGHWEGTTLVVDVTNVNDRVRFSVAGDFASDDVKITERWSWVDKDTIKHSATFEDAKVYSRPFTVAKTIKRLNEPDFEIMEYSGVEGEKDAHLMVDIPATVKKDEEKK